MTLFERIRNLWRFKPERDRVYIRQRQGGMLVTEDTAQTYSAVNACVRLISETLAAIPWQVYRKLDSGREAMPRSPIQWLLNFQANPEQTAYIFRRTMLANQLLWGNAYAEIERGGDGRAMWLWPLPPDRCTLERSETGELLVRVRVEQQEFVLPRANVYMLSDGSHDGILGASRIQLARRAIGGGMAGDQLAASLFENGAYVGGIITNKGKTLSSEAVKTLLATFNEKFSGPERAAKTLYIDGGMEYQKAGMMPMTDAQFIENRRFQVEEICRWFGVPQHLVQELSESNYAVSYEASKNFIEHTLRPLAVLMEQEANVRLFGVRSQSTIYSRMNLAGLLRADPKTRGEYYRSLINAGVMSINEVRELEELNSIGADGDEHFLQLNMTTVKRIADGTTQQDATPSAPPAVEPEPAPIPAPPEAKAKPKIKAKAKRKPKDNVIRTGAVAWLREQQRRQANG